MITSSDSFSSYDLGKYFAVLPQTTVFDLPAYLTSWGATPVTPGFNYCSGTNSEWLLVDDLRRLIRTHVDPQFSWETY